MLGTHIVIQDSIFGPMSQVGKLRLQKAVMVCGSYALHCSCWDMGFLTNTRASLGTSLLATSGQKAWVSRTVAWIKLFVLALGPSRGQMGILSRRRSLQEQTISQRLEGFNTLERCFWRGFPPVHLLSASPWMSGLQRGLASGSPAGEPPWCLYLLPTTLQKGSLGSLSASLDCFLPGKQRRWIVVFPDRLFQGQ